jgi:hypothetical protein
MKPRLLAACLLLLTACGPKTQELKVVYVRGDFAHLMPDTWEAGETKDCQFASRTSVAPDGRGDLFLCGIHSGVLWVATKFAAQIPALSHTRDVFYEDAKTFPVAIHGTGQDQPWVDGSGHSAHWQCKKMADRIDCN